MKKRDRLEKYTNLPFEEIHKKCGVYLIESKDQKRYIGESKDIANRLNDHISDLFKNEHVNEHLQYSFDLNGIEHFTFDIIEFCEPWERKRREHHWATVLYVHDRDRGYNIQPTDPDGEMNISEETRKKISKAHTGKKLSAKSIQAIKDANTGRKFTDEHKAKIGKATKSRPVNIENIEKLETDKYWKKDTYRTNKETA